MKKASLKERLASEEIIRSCMNKQGFVYESPAIEPIQEGIRGMEAKQRFEFVRENGYGVAQGILQQRELVPPQIDEPGYGKAFGICQIASLEVPIVKYSRKTSPKYAALLAELYKSPEYLDADQRWKGCMIKAGFKTDLPALEVYGPFRDEAEVIAGGPEGQKLLNQLLRREREMALVDHNCRLLHIDAVESVMIDKAISQVYLVNPDPELVAAIEYYENR